MAYVKKSPNNSGKRPNSKQGNYGKPNTKPSYNRDDRQSGYNRDGGKIGYNRDDRQSGYNRDGGKMGYNRDDRQSGYNRDGGKMGYNRDDRQSGYNRDGGKPGYNRDDRQSGYNRDGGKPSYNRDDRQSGYNRDGGKPSYNRDDRQSGYNRDGGKPGYNRDDRQSGYNRDGGKMGYNRDDRQSGYNRDGGKPSYNRDDRQSGYNHDGDKPYERRGGNRTHQEQQRGYKPNVNEQVLPTDIAPQQEVEEQLLPNIIMGRNAVKEAIKSGRSIDKIIVTDQQDGSLHEIIGLARDRNLIIQDVSKQKLDEVCLPFGHGGKTGNHQGIVAYMPGTEYCSISDMLEYAKERNEAPFIILLDCIEDPYNLGSIIRSAECAGAHGVVIPKRRCASLNAWAVKASAGAVSYMKVSRVANITAAIDELKAAGLWIAGADMAGTSAYSVDLKGALALVIGNESAGMSRLVKERCDYLVSIPMHGQIDSLNAGSAAAVIMFEKRRQDM